MVVIERMTPQTALVFKDVRLRALQDSPTAFSSTYAKESQLSDLEWDKRLARWTSDGAAIFLAFEGEVGCGIVGAYQDENPQTAQVISMWVDPGHRHAGVGKKLIDAVVVWAAACGVRELKLMVTSVNPGATAFYKRMGFTTTGKTGPYPNDPAITEHEMVRGLNRDS